MRWADPVAGGGGALRARSYSTPRPPAPPARMDADPPSGTTSSAAATRLIWCCGRSWPRRRMVGFWSWVVGRGGLGYTWRGVGIGLPDWTAMLAWLLLLESGRLGCLCARRLVTHGALNCRANSGWCLLPCSSCSCSRGQRSGSIACAAWLGTCDQADARRWRLSSGCRRLRRGALPCPMSVRSTGGSTRACRSTPGLTPTRSSFGACGRPSHQGGKLSEEVDEVRLRRLFAELLEREGIAAGLAPVGRREIPATEAHVGSTVILLERGA